MTRIKPTCRVVLVSVWLVLAVSAPLLAAERIEFEVRETAGIRRFGYPVSTRLAFPKPQPATTRFRVLYEGKPVAAQIRPLSKTPEPIAEVQIDFATNHFPYQSLRYTLEFAAEGPTGRELPAGMAIRKTGDSFLVSNRSYITWTVPSDLRGLLRSVKTRVGEFLQPDSRGLMIRTEQGVVRLGGPQTKARIVSEGPIACGLEFLVPDANSGLRSTVTIDFTRTKSWADVTWTVADPHGRVIGLDVDLSLSLETGRTLVDFGAGSLVYMALSPGQSGVLEGGRPASGRSEEKRLPVWRTLRGPAEKLQPFVLGPTTGKSSLPEGWCHVMDRRRCTALALWGFGRKTRDSIRVSAAGRLQVSRDFSDAETAPPKGSKSLKFWIHLVGMPMHIGAATSPQSMQTPLEVRRLPTTND